MKNLLVLFYGLIYPLTSSFVLYELIIQLGIRNLTLGVCLIVAIPYLTLIVASVMTNIEFNKKSNKSITKKNKKK